MRCPACLADDESVGDRSYCGERHHLPDDGVSRLFLSKCRRCSPITGVFGLIPCAAILGPAALLLGILGLLYVGRNPQAKGTGHAIAGIVLGAIEALVHLTVLIVMLIGAAR